MYRLLIVAALLLTSDATRLSAADMDDCFRGSDAMACRRLSEHSNAEMQGWAEVTLGEMYMAGRGVAQDTNQGMEWIRKAAEHGNARAENILGLLYERGRGVIRDPTEALKWYRKSADQGNIDAQVNLGDFLMARRPTPELEEA